jgi:hypothetical protein
MNLKNLKKVTLLSFKTHRYLEDCTSQAQKVSETVA